jgi:hypothetical protein
MITDQISNVLSKAILRACWQKEDEQGMQEARPWLRWFLTRVIRMMRVPRRESEGTQASKRRWLTKRQEEALKIDPETAEVFFNWGSVVDPYGLYPDPDADYCIGRNYFARSPTSEVWVSFDDLPTAVCDRLSARMKAGDSDNDDLSWLFDGAHARGVDPASTDKQTSQQ